MKWGAQPILVLLKAGAALTRVFCPAFGGDGLQMEEVGEVDFDDERAMQAIVGSNLEVIFPDLEIVGHEIVLNRWRFDTVAFNVKTKSFVLIEYKKVQSKGALEQVLDYLEALDGNEGNFLQACKEQGGKKYEKKDVAWDKTKAFLITPSFTDPQLGATKHIKGRPIELYNITKYQNRIMTMKAIVGSKPEKNKKSTNGDNVVNSNVLSTSLEKILHEDLHLEKEEAKVYDKWVLKNGEVVCTVSKQIKTLVLCYTTKSLEVDKADVSFVRYMVKNGKKIGVRGRGEYMSTIRSVGDVKRAVRYLEQVCTQKTKSIVYQRRRGDEKLPSQDDTKYVMQKGSSRTIALYAELKNTLCNSIPHLKFIVTKRYINCKSTVHGKLICSVVVNKKALKLSYNTRRLDVPESDDSFVRHLFNNGKWISIAAPGDYDSKLEAGKDVERAIPYIKKVHLQKVAI